LPDQVQLKRLAARMSIIAQVPLSLSLVLATQLIVAQTLGSGPALRAAGGVAVLIGAFWWVFPMLWRDAIYPPQRPHSYGYSHVCCSLAPMR
jgi:hypothetical protein